MFLTPEIINYLLIFSFLISLGALTFSFILLKKIKKLLIGEAKNLPESLENVRHEIESLKTFRGNANRLFTDIQKKLGKTVQGLELVRFNPFKGGGAGGNQSFTTSFVNEKGDGIVVSGLYYSGDRMNVFVKPVKGFSSNFELMEEELEVIERSKKTIES